MKRGSQLASIILAAGQGTRMRSERAKVLHELGGEPLVSWPIRLSVELGATPIVLVVGHQRDAVREAVTTRWGEQVQFAEQLEQRGTGHAVMQGLPLVGRADSGTRVLILYGDVPLLTRATVDALSAQGSTLSLVTTRVSNPKGYGRIVRDGSGRITRIVEEKDATEEERRIDEINAGIYLVEASFLELALSRLSNDNAQKEYYLTDIVGTAIRMGLEVGWVEVQDPGEVLGVNTRAELALLEGLMRRATNERLMREGVSIVDPATTYISRDAEIARDTVIHPGVHIRGRTVIGEGSTIDVGCILTHATIGRGVRLAPYTVVESATVRDGAVAGPFSRLRPATEVMEGAHVGNFVELKNTKLGPGAKANHLAYLGDASIGEGANIGAGTITCNYDGFGKYQTTIGDNVFVGSNSTLVAPVTIERDAYVAAGSTITDPVGPADLAFGRARQENKQGRAQPLRERAKERAQVNKRNKGDKGAR